MIENGVCVTSIYSNTAWPTHSIDMVISGGQTGADQAGWRAAKRCGIRTIGWMPKGFKTEDGNRPDFAELYGATETVSPGYPERTRRNAQAADITLWFGDPKSRGGIATLRDCRHHLIIWPGHNDFDWKYDHAADLLSETSRKFRTLNIAGNRETTSPGIGQWVEAYLVDVFRSMK